MQSLKQSIHSCTLCAPDLPLGCNPIFTAAPNSKIVLIGQAPGKRVHESSIPWNDKSGDNLRRWLGVTKAEFYNEELFALMPMGFCYPGTGKSGDLPPRKECAPKWHPLLWEAMTEVQLVLLVGQYAQKYYLKKVRRKNLTETVKDFQAYLPRFFPLPHPSPRNNIWQKKNPWFAEAVLPILAQKVAAIKANKAEHPIDQRQQLQQHPFTYQFTKDKKLMIYRDNKFIKIVKGKLSTAFFELQKNADEQSIQLKLAKLTGHYKHGNER